MKLKTQLEIVSFNAINHSFIDNQQTMKNGN